MFNLGSGISTLLMLTMKTWIVLQHADNEAEVHYEMDVYLDGTVNAE